MAIFKLPRFLRRFFRRNMNPRTEEQVWSAKDKFSIAYAIIAWNAAGYVLWQIFGKKNVHWPVDVGIKNVEEENVRPAFQFAHMLGIQKASVYRISGTSVSDRLEFQVDKNVPLPESFRIINAPLPDFDREEIIDPASYREPEKNTEQ